MIHREGIKSILWGGGLVILSLVIAMIWVHSKIIISLFLLFEIGILTFLIQFFRNPKRTAILVNNEVLSPADGTIVVFERVFEPEFLKQDAIQISIFMSPFNIHKNLNPLNALVKKVCYHPGKFLVAFNPKSSTDNERCSFLYMSNNGKEVVMRQIAGAMARRIVYYISPEQRVIAGQEMGFIKFGSRVDLFLPLDYSIKVKLKDKVQGGISLIATP